MRARAILLAFIRDSELYRLDKVLSGNEGLRGVHKASRVIGHRSNALRGAEGLLRDNPNATLLPNSEATEGTEACEYAQSELLTISGKLVAIRNGLGPRPTRTGI